MIAVVKKGLFKKASFIIPDEFLDKCEGDKKSKKVFVKVKKNTIVLGVDEKSIKEKTPSIPKGINIKLNDKGATSTYKDVIGFFSFRGDIFYRTKGAAGKHIVTGDSFTDVLKKKYPEEFGSCKVQTISSLEVLPLKVEE